MKYNVSRPPRLTINANRRGHAQGFTETAAGAETNGDCEDVVKHGVLEATCLTNLVNYKVVDIGGSLLIVKAEAFET